MKLICFEDDAVGQLRPITHARPAYAITCASYQLLDWLRELPADLMVSIRGYLGQLQKLDQDLHPPSAEKIAGEEVMLVNARLVPRVETRQALIELAKRTAPFVVRCPETGSMVVAKLLPGHEEPGSLPTSQDRVAESASPFQKSGKRATAQLTRSGDDGITTRLLERAAAEDVPEITDAAAPMPLFHRPHEVVAWHMREMPAAMEHRLAKGDYNETADGVFVAKGVSIGKYAVVETDDGPILLDEDVKVGPFCFLSGPVYAGPRTRVIEHAALKDGVALGHTVKIGGEVEASVIEPFTNKQHHGFLGHSYLGSWINLGAGTCNSDLKNTYGKINIEYGGEKVSTGMQFLGCIMGDYSKTAINTSIFTGKVIGVCSMLYGFATSNVPSYVNYARLFGQQSLLPAEVMVNTQQRMFARRNVVQRECDIQLIQDMYRLTADERETSDPYGY